MKPQRTCPCHATAEEHAAFEASIIAALRAGTAYDMLSDYLSGDDFDDAGGCICGDPHCNDKSDYLSGDDFDDAGGCICGDPRCEG